MTTLTKTLTLTYPQAPNLTSIQRFRLSTGLMINVGGWEMSLGTVAETWRRVWGDGNFFLRTQDIRMTFFGGRISIFAAKISDDFFLVIDQSFQIFSFFSQIFPIFAMLNVIFDPFLTRKTPFVTLFILSRASDNTTSLNIGGTNAWAVLHLKFLGDRPPPVPPGLRPCRRGLSALGASSLG